MTRKEDDVGTDFLAQIASLHEQLERSEKGKKKLEHEMVVLLDAANAEEDAKTAAEKKLEDVKAELAIALSRLTALEAEISGGSSHRPALSIGSSICAEDERKANHFAAVMALSNGELQARLNAVSSAHTLMSSQLVTLQASLASARALLQDRTDLCARLETMLIESVSESARDRDRLCEAEKAHEELKAKAHAAEITSFYNQELLAVERMQKESLEALIASAWAELETVRAQKAVERQRRLEELENPTTPPNFVHRSFSLPDIKDKIFASTERSHAGSAIEANAVECDMDDKISTLTSKLLAVTPPALRPVQEKKLKNVV